MLIPCIDLQGGQAVQLVNGRRRELFVADVLGLLERFQGYEWLHVIDLDAAMNKGHNDRLVKELCLRATKQYKMKVRVGGGIRTTVRAAAIAGFGVEPDYQQLVSWRAVPSRREVRAGPLRWDAEGDLDLAYIG